MKNIILAILVLAGISAAASYDVCWPQYVSCSENCCNRIDGDFSEDSDGVYCDYGEGLDYEFYSCDDSCVMQELNCLAPASGCASQYSYCVDSCGGPGYDSCNSACGDNAFNCADDAALNPAPAPIPSSGGCCGAFIMLFTGTALALFARKG